jgi:alkanesulfonate monooxygenase SsuD/methylene tetrahydromethanopterin reductase-like flavin-dependent oxidoreductase (luciferase family)
MRMMECSVVGSPHTVVQGLQAFVDSTQADELIVNCTVFDHEARLKSLTLLAELSEALRPAEFAVQAA